jgi:hypothetical protein
VYIDFSYTYRAHELIKLIKKYKKITHILSIILKIYEFICTKNYLFTASLVGIWTWIFIHTHSRTERCVNFFQIFFKILLVDVYSMYIKSLCAHHIVKHEQGHLKIPTYECYSWTKTKGCTSGTTCKYVVEYPTDSMYVHWKPILIIFFWSQAD